MRRIDADALMQTVCGKECGQHFKECNLNDDNDDTRCVFRDYVKSAPTIETEPVRHGQLDKDKPLTNGDRIRAMTDEELAEFLHECWNGIDDWLRQEVNNE